MCKLLGAQAVKLVRTPGLWRNLCLSAIRSRRHQVVHFCLDNMEDAQCAQAARCPPCNNDTSLPLCCLLLCLSPYTCTCTCKCQQPYKHKLVLGPYSASLSPCLQSMFEVASCQDVHQRQSLSCAAGRVDRENVSYIRHPSHTEVLPTTSCRDVCPCVCACKQLSLHKPVLSRTKQPFCSAAVFG